MSSRQKLEVVLPEQIRVVPAEMLAFELFKLGMWGQGEIEFEPDDTFASVATCLYVREPEFRPSEVSLADVTNADRPTSGFENTIFAEINTEDNQSRVSKKKDTGEIERDKTVFRNVNPRVFTVSAVAVTARGLHTFLEGDGLMDQKRELRRYVDNEKMQNMGSHVLMVAGERNCFRLFGGGKTSGYHEDDGARHRLLTSFDR